MTSRRPVVSVYPGVARRIERRAQMSLSRETGGVLLGFRVDGGIHVVDAVEIRDRQATRTRYVLRKWAADAALADHLSGLPDDSPVGYVGLWHTHLACAEPSPVDRRTLRREATAVSGPLALLVVARCKDGWQLFAHLSGQSRRRCTVAVDVDYPSGSSGNGSPLGGGNDGST